MNYFIVLNISATLEPTYRQLKAMKLDGSPFVIISVIGQELLAQGKYSNAVEVLESALKIGTCSLKLRGSVFSALSSAYWALNSLDKVQLIISAATVTIPILLLCCHNWPFRIRSWFGVPYTIS